MPPVTVLILAPQADTGAGPLVRLLDEARTAMAEHHRLGFLAAGADAVLVRREPADDTPFGARLRRLVGELRPAGLVVLGAGSMPLATSADRRAFVEAAAGNEPAALANHRFSADAIAIARADLVLEGLPPALDSDNALPRWLREGAGVVVRDLRSRRRLAMDLDSPLDVLILRGVPGAPDLPPLDDRSAGTARRRLASLRRLAADPGAELLLSGRVSAGDLRWAEQHTQSRTRAWVEERGLRTAAAGTLVGRPNRRPPRSILGTLLDRDGPGSLGRHLGALADGAIVDTRVLIAHRLGADERAWPTAEDRFASDLLLAESVHDPWLSQLTAAAAEAPIPILLGGHGPVGPGARLILRGGRTG